MAQKVCIASHKGGVGKTSMTCWLADSMSRAGLRVLVIDGDPQGAASDVFGWDGEVSSSLAAWFDSPKSPEKLIYTEHKSGVHIVPNTMNSFISAHKLETQSGSARWSPGAYLIEFINLVEDKYDLILIDSPPHWDIHLLNCLRASDFVLIPLIPDAKGLKGVQILLGLISREIERGVDMPKVTGLCIHRTKPRTKTCRDVIEYLRDSYGPIVFNAEVSDSVAFAESDAMGSISPLSAKPGSVTSEQIVALAKEIGSRLAEKKAWQAKELSHLEIAS